MSLYEGAAKRPIMTSLCFSAVVIFGLSSLSRLPVDLYPNIDTGTIMAMTAYPGASASDTEDDVTRPLENTLDVVSNLERITSRSSENMSLITLEFELGNDIDVLTNDVRDKLDMVGLQLPGGIENPIVFKFSTDMTPIVLLSVQANESQAAFCKILDDRVVNLLARIPGVGTVSISGVPQHEIQVYCNPNKLEAYNLSIETINFVIGAESKNIPGGDFDTGSKTYAPRVERESDGSRQLADIVMGTHNGANAFLRDVARIMDMVKKHAQEAYDSDVQGAMVVVQKQSGTNSVEVSRKVKEALPRLQKNLPSDVKLGVIVGAPDNISNMIDSLAETIMYVLSLAVIVVLLFLGRWHMTLIICTTISLSLIISFIYLTITGNTINIISLLSLPITIGTVADDTITVLENVTAHIERGLGPKQAAVHRANEVAISIIASMLTMIVVFFPLTMVSGVSGVLFKQLGWMICAIMLMSIVAVLPLIPMFCSQLLRLQKRPSKIFKPFFTLIEKALDALDTGYAKILDWAVHHRPIVIAEYIAFFVVSLLCVKGVGTEFFSVQDSARTVVQPELPIDIRRETARELSEKLADQWLTEYRGITRVCNYTIGQTDPDNTWVSMQDNGSYIISFNISLTDPGDRDISLEAVCDEMRQDLKGYPGSSKAQITLGGSNTDMSVQVSADFEIYGYDTAMAGSVVARLKCELLTVKGVTEMNISRNDYQPRYQVDFDREKLAMHGLNLTTVGNYLRNRINGAVVSRYCEDGDEYGIKVHYVPEYRANLESIENILIYNAKDESVHIRDVGKVVGRFAPPTIGRKDRERIVTVSAVISGAPLGSIVIVGSKLIDRMDIPGEVTIQISGSYGDQQDSFHDSGTSGIPIAVLIFVVIAIQFEFPTYPFIIMFSLPFALSGVLMTLFFTGNTLNVMSLLGGIMLIGIVVKNGIVLINYITLCRERDMTVINSVVTSDRSCLRSVLMITVTTILGTTPMAIGGGQGPEMQSSIAIAIIGGLIVSTVLAFALIPTLYCVFAGADIKNRRCELHRKHELNTYFQGYKGEIIKK